MLFGSSLVGRGFYLFWEEEGLVKMVFEIIFCKCSYMFKFFEVGYLYENLFY